jgi:hypothetical protein
MPHFAAIASHRAVLRHEHTSGLGGSLAEMDHETPSTTPAWQERVVELTTAPRRLTREQSYALGREQSYALGAGRRVTFHLRVFTASGQPSVVIAGNLDGDTGTSVTNAIEHIAADLATSVLPGQRFALVEYYPDHYRDLKGAAAAEFTPVTFDGDGCPQWDRELTQQQMEAIVDQPVIVFPAGYYTVENVEHVKHAPVAQLAADALVPACPEHRPSGPQLLRCDQHGVLRPTRPRATPFPGGNPRRTRQAFWRQL